MRVCFVVGTFTEISEKFIIDQVDGVIEAGYDVDIVSAYPATAAKRHAAIDSYHMLDWVTYLP